MRTYETQRLASFLANDQKIKGVIILSELLVSVRVSLGAREWSSFGTHRGETHLSNMHRKRRIDRTVRGCLSMADRFIHLFGAQSRCGNLLLYSSLSLFQCQRSHDGRKRECETEGRSSSYE